MIQIAALGLPKPYGIFAVANYLFLGAVGLPVFSFGGGIHLFFEKTGGYLVGFLIATVVLQIFRDFFLSKPIITLIGLFLHTLVIFTLGILWHSYVDQLGVTKLIFAMQPFFAMALLKIVLTFAILGKVRQQIEKRLSPNA